MFRIEYTGESPFLGPQARLMNPLFTLGRCVRRWFSEQYEEAPMWVVAFLGTDQIRRLYVYPPEADHAHDAAICEIFCADANCAEEFIRTLAHGWGLADILEKHDELPSGEIRRKVK